MSKYQIAILALLVLIACSIFALAGLLWYGYTRSQAVAVQPTAAEPTEQPPTPTITNTPTNTSTPFELPTAQTEKEATPTNTPVVQATPSPTPGETFTDLLTGHKATPKPTQRQEASQPVQQSGPNVQFWADSTSVQAGSCTNLHWRTAGVTSYWIDGQPGAGPEGSLHLCPKSTETHTLKYDETVNGLLRSKEIQVTISVYQSGSSSGGSTGGSSSGSGSGGESTGGGSSQILASGQFWDEDAGVMVTVGGGQVSWAVDLTRCGNTGQGSTAIGKDYHVTAQNEIYKIEFFLNNSDKIVGSVDFFEPYDALCGPSRAFVAEKYN